MQKSHKHMRGFEYLIYSAFSLTLLLVLLLLPLAPIFANEESSTSSEVESSGTQEQISTETESQTEHEDDSRGVSLEEETEIVTNNSEGIEHTVILPSEPDVALQNVSNQVTHELEDGTVHTALVDTDITQTDTISEEIQAPETIDTHVPSDVSVSTEAEVTELIATSTDTVPADPIMEKNATSSETIVPAIPVDEAATSTPHVPDEPIEVVMETALASSTSTTEASTTTSPEPQEAIAHTALKNESSFSFSLDECVSVGGGSFYCSNATTAPASIGVDRVFSAADQNADREIYVEKGGAISQITDNALEDDAPYYDEVSDTMVWHRLIDGRYQIISYDVETGEEKQLTHDRYNNMQPSRYGDLTVWQGWVGNDWEVMLEDNGELTMISDNTIQDVSPRINGNYVVWQAFDGGAWRVKVFDRTTGQTETIADSEGASVDNPRFVLVYDSKDENGDIETKGYDLASGEVTPLSATPAPVPEEIPDPEQTGEERALVTSPVQPKTKTDDTTDDGPGGPDLEDTEEGDIVVTPFIDPLSPTSSPMSSIDAEHSELELIVPTDSSATTSSLEHIEDIIVTPYVEPIQPIDMIISEVSNP